MPDRTRTIIWRYGGAVLFSLLALALRWSLDPWLGDHLPFVTFFVSVAGAAWLGGLRPALLATGLGFVLALYFFVPPRFSRIASAGPHLFGLTMYFMVSFAFVGLGEALHIARKRAESGRELVAVTLASIADAVIATDKMGHVTFLNEMACQLTGWNSSDARGKPLADVFPIIDERTRQPITNPVEKVLKDGQPIGLSNHTVLVRRDGQEQPIDNSAAPIRNARGDVLGVVLVFRDVGDKRRAEEKLRRSEEELTDFFENAGVGLHWVGADGTILRVNRAELELLGYSRNEYVGRNIAEFHVEQDVIQDILRRLQTGEILHGYPARMRCKDGSIKDVLIDSSVHLRDGQFVHTRCFTRDVTEQLQARSALEESEQRFRQLAENIADVFWMADPFQGALLYVSPAYEVVWGRSCQSLYQQPRSFVEGIHPDDRGRVIASLEKQARGENTAEEYRVVRPDGTVRWVWDRGFPIRNASGSVCRVAGIAEDITERKTVDEALRDSESRLRRMVESNIVGLIVADFQGRILEANKEFLRMTDFSEDDVRAGRLNFLELTPPEYHALDQEAMKELTANGKHAPFEKEYFRRDGSRVPVLVGTAYLGRDRQGQELVVGFLLDLTERKKAEQSLRESEQRFRGLMEQAPFSIQIFSPSGQTIRTNRAWEELWGVTLEEIQAYNILEDKQLEERGVLPFIRRAFAGEAVEIPAIEYNPNDTIPHITRLDDPRRCVAAVAYPLKDASGRVEEVVLVHEDQTARVRAEEALRASEATLRAFYDNSPLLMGVTEPTDDGDILHVYDNPATCRFFRTTLTSGKRALAQLGADPAAVARWLKCYRQSELTGQPVHFEQEHPTPDGPRWLSATVSHIGAGPEGRARFCYVAEDVTDRRRRQEDLRESEERLRLALEAGRMGVWDWNLQRNEVRWSETLEPLPGLAPGGFSGTLTAFQELIHPEDRPLVQQAVQRALDERSSYEAEFRILWPDHSIHWMAGKGKVFSENERATRMVGIGMDITDRKRAEEQLHEETRLAETLNRVGRLLAAEFDLHKIVQTVTDEATGLTTAEFGAFFYNVTNDQGEAYTLYTLSGVPREAFEKFPTPRNTAIFNPTFKGEGVVRLDDVTADPRYGHNAPYHGMPEGHLPVRSYLAVPVISRTGEVLGGLFFGHSQRGVFTERHERLVVGIVAQAAIAIDNARLFESAQREQLRAETSERHYRTLAEVVPQLVWTTKPDGSVDWCNQRWCDATGLSFAESLGSGWTKALHPDDLNDTVKAWNRATSTGSLYEVEYRFKSPDGGYRWYIGRALPLHDEHGQIVEWFGTCTDIHDQKLSEQASRFLAEASAALAAVVDYHSTLQKVASLAVPRFSDWCAVDIVEPDGSLQQLAVAHCDPQKVQLAHELGRRYPPDPAAPVGVPHVARTGQSELSEYISDALLEQVAQDEEHLHILRALGLKSYMCVPMASRGRVLGVITFVAAESGRTYGAHDLAIAEELAGRAAVAIENARLYAELREADRRKDEFLATLAHELRNPLAPIRNSLQILKMPIDDRSLLDHAREMMERQVQHLVRLVDDLLDVSRVMRGKVELRKETVDLATIIARAVETAQPVIDAQGHELTITLPPEPLEIEADPVRLSQVVGNLLTNAAKYTQQDGRIWLTAERQNGQAVLRVRDNGIGIAPEMLPRIFDLFVQVENSVSRSQGGLGIGLTLAKSLVEKHGGTIEATSSGLGQGSEFLVRLPLSHEGFDERRRRKSSEQATTQQTPRRRVLVVDDNVDAAESLAMLLRLGGNEVQVAHGGPAALEIVQVLRPEIIFLDIGMPVMDGYEVSKRIRQFTGLEHVLLVALTGWGQESDRRRSTDAGFDVHLVKPVEPDTLNRVLVHPKLSSAAFSS